MDGLYKRTREWRNIKRKYEGRNNDNNEKDMKH